MVFWMPKTLVIAEKPSVGRDLAGALEGPFQRRKLDDIKPKRGKKKVEETNEEVVEAAKSTTKTRTTRDEAVFLESDDYVITWAVGHLVQLAEPEEYDEKWKKWKMADLPIVPPNGFKLVPRDAKSKKQPKLIETLLGGGGGLTGTGGDSDPRGDRKARARDPGVRPRAVPPHPRDVPAALPGTLVRGRRNAHLRRPHACGRDRRQGLRPGRDGREGRAQGTVRARATPVRPDLAPARREPALRLLRAAHAAGRTVPLRKQEGDHVSAYVFALPLRRHGRAAEADRRHAAADRGLQQGRRVRARARPATARPRRQRCEGQRPPRGHSDRHRERPRGVHARRAPCVRPRCEALPRGVPPAGAICPHDSRHARRGGAVPHARQDHARGGGAGGLRARAPPGAAGGGRSPRRRESAG